MVQLSDFKMPISKRLPAALFLCALPLIAFILRPVNGNAQLFVDPCDRVQTRQGAYCYNWKSQSAAAVIGLRQHYVIVSSVGNGYVKATTPYGSATGKWAGNGDVILIEDDPGFLRGRSKIGCLGRKSTGRKWGVCQFID